MVAQEVVVLYARAMRRQMDVGSLAALMLRVAHSAHSLVEPRAAVARVDAYGSELVAQGLQHSLAEVAQRDDVLRRGGVVDVEPPGSGARHKLAEAEVLRQRHL